MNILSFKKFKKIKSFLIDPKLPNYLISKFVKNKKDIQKYSFNIYSREFIKKYGKNITAETTLSIPFTFMPNRGLEKKHFTDLLKWSKSSKKPKYLFLDFDRTITVLDHFEYLPSSIFHKFKKDEYFNDQFYFIMGGKERYKMLKKYFKKLIKNNVKIYVITYNCAAFKNKRFGNRSYFIKCLKKIIPNFSNNRLISCDHSKTKDISLIKHFGKKKSAQLFM